MGRVVHRRKRETTMKDLAVNDQLIIPAAELQVGFARSGGPGGQNVNKVESKVELRWNPAQSAVLGGADRDWLLERLAGRLTQAGDLLVTSSKTRDQAKNRDDAMAKLAAIVRAALERPKARRRTRPSRAAEERRIQEKKRRADVKKARRDPGDQG
jgi:ribosome-associated protein